MRGKRGGVGWDKRRGSVSFEVYVCFHSDCALISLPVRLNKALNVRPDGVSITSFNEWGEGTQIEPAGEWVEGGMGGVYGPEYREAYGGLYLGLTKKIVGRWRRDNELVEEGGEGGGEEL